MGGLCHPANPDETGDRHISPSNCLLLLLTNTGQSCTCSGGFSIDLEPGLDLQRCTISESALLQSHRSLGYRSLTFTFKYDMSPLTMSWPPPTPKMMRKWFLIFSQQASASVCRGFPREPSLEKTQTLEVFNGVFYYSASSALYNHSVVVLLM